MLKTTEVLTALSDLLSPGDLKEFVERFIRSPEVWHQLHDPEFLEQLKTQELSTDSTPGELAALVLGLPSLDPSRVTLTLEQDDLIQSLFQHAVEGEQADQNLESIAWISIGFLNTLPRRDGFKEVIELVLQQPEIWKPVLKYVWPYLDSAHFGSECIEAAEIKGVGLIAQILLANMSPKEAAVELAHWDSSLFDRIVVGLNEADEQILLQEFTDAIDIGAQMIPIESDKLSIDTWLASSIRDKADGDFAGALKVLDHAWEHTSRQSGVIADHIGRLAAEENDHVLELEARQQALQSFSTPYRRAWLSQAMLKLDRVEDALEVLQKDPITFEEHFAIGSARLALGDRETAVKHLQHAARNLLNREEADLQFVNRLLSGLLEVDEIHLALEIARWRTNRYPSVVAWRIELGEISAQAGNPEMAIEEANLALALDPEANRARQILARSLQSIGEPHSALPHWQAVAEIDSTFLPDLAECALEIGQIELAHQTGEKLLHMDQNSFQGQVVLGKTLVAKGDYPAAKVHLEKALQSAPKSPQVWLALADSQIASGDELAAGVTLSAGVQASPESGSLHHALAEWHKDQGHLSDALESAKQAVFLDRSQPKWLTEYGNLLTDLGHYDQALPILQEAVARRPESWESRRTLIELYEARGEHSTAAQFIHRIPQDASPEDHFLAGRILAKSVELGETISTDRIITHLENAQRDGVQDPVVDYWIGTAHEKAGQKDDAFLAFRTCMENTVDENQELHLKATLGFARTATNADLASLALSTLEDAHKRYPTSIDLLVALADAYLHADLPEQALRIAHQASDLDPSAPEAFRMQSRAATKIGMLEVAIRSLQQLVKLQPQEIDSWLQLADLFKAVDKEQGLRESLANAIWLGRRNIDVLKRIADFLEEIGKLVSAQRLLRRATILEPADIEAQQKLAVISDALEDHEASQQAWRKIIELDPENPVPLSRAAEALWSLDRRSAAIGLWQRAASLRPENPQIHIRLARAYRSNGEIERGLEHFDQAYALEKDNPDLGREAGMAYLQHGLPEMAVEKLHAAVQSDNENLQNVMALGECLLQLGKPHEARDMLEIARQLDATNPRAHILYAHAAMDTGDLSMAEESLETVGHLKPDVKDDVVLYAKTALRLGNWEEALNILDDWLSQFEDGSGLVTLERIRFHLRLRDAHWVYGNAANAHQHAPLAPDLNDPLVDELLDRCRAIGIEEKKINNIETWRSISAGVIEEDFEKMTDPSSALNKDAEVIQALAIHFLREGQPDHAEDLLTYSQGIIDPDGWSALLLGICYAASGRYAHARHVYLEARWNPAIQPIVDYLIARSWMSEGNTPKARESLNAAVAAWPQEPQWQYELAEGYLTNGEMDRALPHLQQSVEWMPENQTFRLALGRVQHQLGQWTEAYDSYSQVLDSVHSNGDVWKEAAQVALGTGHLKQAADWFERACTLQPSDPHCLIGAARASMSLGNQRQAMDRAKSAIRLAPNDYEVLLGIGEILATQGKVDKALESYDKALDLTDNPLNIHLARTKLLIQMGRADQAQEGLRSVLAHSPEAHTGWAALAEALEATGAYEQAQDAITEAIRYAPRSSLYHQHLGRLSRITGQLDRAVDELQHAQSLSPTDPQIAMELGLVFEARRDRERALEAYERAIAIDPNNPESHLRAGLLLKEKKAYPQAANMIERAVALNPRDPKILHQLAAVRALELVHGGFLNTVVSS